MSVARRLYSALMTLGQPLLRRKLARRGRQEPGYLEAVEERFGHYRQPPETASELVWLHAVSLGETRTAALLLKALRAQQPSLRLLLTHGTATGRAEGKVLLRPGDVQVWQPWDSPAAVKRFFNHFRPRLGLLMETEIWPNLVAQAHSRAMPLVLVNGRLSEKSMKQALRLAPLALPAYGALSAVLAQTEADASRYRQLGARVAGVFGNLKFDATPDEGQQAQGKAWAQALGQPVLMFASSREGEEDDFFKAVQAMRQAQAAGVGISRRPHLTETAQGEDVGSSWAKPDGRTAAVPATPDSRRILDAPVREQTVGMPASPENRLWTGDAPLGVHMLVVPRHPQRFDEVQALAEQHGLAVSRRSDWPAGGPAASLEALQADIWLGDSLGEMALYYSMSDAALLGGSFAPLGGQNLIEAAACGCPVVMGPHTFNFTEAAELAEAAGAAQCVSGMPQAVQAALALLGNARAQAQAAAAGLAFAARNQGAAARTLAALRDYLE